MSTSSTGVHAAHHFKNLKHQHMTAKLGVWFFLTTEIMMFGGLIAGYVIMHGLYHKMFALGAKELDWRLGGLNTLILIASSYTMALGVHSAKCNQPKKCVRYLIATILFGVGFLSVKAFEYTHKFHHGMAPGMFFNLEEVHHYSAAVAEQMKHFMGTKTAGITRPDMGMYFAFYFCMTGLHASHVIIGMFLIGWVAWRAKRGDFSSEYYTAAEGVGLFWHLVDLIWIYLFPLLYLIG